jgi:MFS transporter, FSR family, fosmidomycin resistance protein
MTTATLAETPADPRKRRDLRTIGLVGFAHGTSHFFHLLLPPLFPWLMKDFNLTFTQVGGLMTIFFVISGIGQALSGFVVDRVGAPRVLFGGVTLLGLAGVFLGFADSVPMLAVAAGCAGLGNSVFHPADYSILNHRVSAPRLPLAFSVHGLSGNLGWAAAPLFLMTIASSTNWHLAAFAASSVAVVSLALLYVNRDLLDFSEEAKARREQPRRATATFAFLGVPAIWLCFAFFFLTTMAFGALQNFATPLLAGMYSIGLATAASGLTAYLLGSACGMAFGGFAAGRMGTHDRMIVAALTLAAVMAIVLATGVLPAMAAIAAMSVLGFGVGVAGPSRDLLVRQAAAASLGGNAYGRVYGFVYSGLDSGLAVSPLVFGPLMDHGHFHAVLYVVAAIQCVAILTGMSVGHQGRLAARPA